nr:zinc finger CW type PWWP domain protein 1 [Hymenolepis microstoma]
MVNLNRNGCYADYDPVTHKVTHYEVVFLDPHVMTIRRIPAKFVQKYVSGELINEDLLKSKYWRKIQDAMEEAENALKLPIQIRLETFGYEHPKNSQSSNKPSHSQRREIMAENQQQKTLICKVTRRGRPRKRKEIKGDSFSGLCVSNLTSFLAKGPLIREMTVSKNPTLMKALPDEVSKSENEGSPSFLNPPLVETLQLVASNQKVPNLDSNCYDEFSNLLTSAGSLSTSPDSRCFNVSLSQETVIKELSITSSSPNSSLDKTNVEDNISPVVVALGQSQEFVPENSNQSYYAEGAYGVTEYLSRTSLEASDFYLDMRGANSSQIIGSTPVNDDNADIPTFNKVEQESSMYLLQETAENISQKFRNSASNSMLGFLEQSIKSRLNERIYLIKKVSEILTNLPLDLQFKPAGVK